MAQRIAKARFVESAEPYCRIIYHDAAESRNPDNTHLFEALCQVLEAKGPDTKAIVWTHNSQIGNGRSASRPSPSSRHCHSADRVRYWRHLGEGGTCI